MGREHLGPQIDIHGGGSDLIFPYHENEIAQNKALARVEGEETPSPERAAPLIEILVGLRAELRERGLFPLADKIRRQLAAQGITLEDTPEGTRWRA